MAIGASNRVVIELPANVKQALYAVLKGRGQTLRDWFLSKAQQEIVASATKPRRKPK